MTAQTHKHVVDQLRDALENRQVPARQHALGAQIIDHLSDAVRIVVIGRSNCGKSSLINMFLGSDVLGKFPISDMTEVVYGPKAQVSLTWPDGATQTFSGLAIDPQSCAGVIRARIELPDDSLQAQSFCEINLPEDAEQQPQVFQAALQSGQVFVWCSEQFDVSEQALWHSAPDAIKDHSFLALTKADRQMMKGDLPRRLEALDEIVADEFLGLHPIATLHALSARSGDTFKQDLWVASGGRDLMDAVQAQVRSGRAAELDRAAMLLAQLVEAPAQSAPSPHHRSKPQDAKSHVEKTGHEELLDQLQLHLQSCAQDLISDLDKGLVPDGKAILKKCANTVHELTAMLSENPDDGVDVSGLLDDARDGEEMLMLLQVEQSPTAAEDAVFLMLQLKKEIGARVQA